MLAGSFLLARAAFAAAPNYVSSPKATETKYKTPEDLLDLVPFLGEIPRTFLFGDGYSMKLTPQELRIDHMGLRSRAKPAQRQCMIGFSYVTPVAGFFTTRIDIPVLNSPTVALADWSVSSLGDYVVYMSRLPVEHTSIRLSISAKF